MPQFPHKPDPSDLPSELFPDVILPNEKGEMPESQNEPETQQQSDSESGDAETKEPFRYKTRSEAVPEKRRRRRSTTRWELNEQTGEAPPTRNFFSNDELVSEFRSRYAKPVLIVLGFFCLLSIIYLFKLGLTKHKAVAQRTTDQQPV